MAWMRLVHAAILQVCTHTCGQDDEDGRAGRAHGLSDLQPPVTVQPAHAARAAHPPTTPPTTQTDGTADKGRLSTFGSDSCGCTGALHANVSRHVGTHVCTSRCALALCALTDATPFWCSATPNRSMLTVLLHSDHASHARRCAIPAMGSCPRCSLVGSRSSM